MARTTKSHRPIVVTFPSDLGWMALLASDHALRQLTFGHSTPQAAVRSLDADLSAGAGHGEWNPKLVRRLQKFAAGGRQDFRDVEIDCGPQTAFQRRVIEGCRQIPFGRTLTYGELAEKAGDPGAARAVGNVMAVNRIPLIVPCHRVVSSGGSSGGYSAAGGVRTKLRLLEAEAHGGQALQSSSLKNSSKTPVLSRKRPRIQEPLSSQ